MRSFLSSVSPFALFAAAGEGAAGGGKPTVLNEDVGTEDDNSASGEQAAAGEGEPEGGEQAAAGEGEAEGGEGEAEGGEGEAEGGEPKKVEGEAATDWRDREIARKHRKVQERERENADLRQRLADAQALLDRQSTGESGAAAPARPSTPAASSDAVQQEARRIVAQQNYDQQCNTAFEQGNKAYPGKWDGALKNLELLGGLGDGQEGLEVMSGILATDNPSQVLFKLGNNPDEYHRVMGLPPARRLAELVKLGIADAPKPKPKPSGAPVPPAPIARRANVNDDTVKLHDDKTDDATWYAIRKAQKERRFKEKLQAGRA